jgi:3-deoxy-D-manno-octulosonic-acid transferase
VPLPLVEEFCGNRTVIVAGSTWVEDEEELDHFANTHPDIRFILAPHEIGEDRLRDIERLFRHSIRYSRLKAGSTTGVGSGGQGGRRQAAEAGRAANQRGLAGPGGWPEPNVLVIDNIGMLSRLYRYARIAYVGGGFGDDGVHNVLEAAVYGKPVVFGPVIEKYIEAVELTESGGGLIIDSAVEVEKVFDRLIGDQQEREEMGNAAREYVYSRQGATGTIIRFIQEKRLLTS